MARYSMTGSWLGDYSYGPNGPLSVRFTLTARQGWFGRFRGQIEEDPGKGVPLQATVTGQVSGTAVSFVKWYPALYVMHGDRLVAFREYVELQEGMTLDQDVPPVPILYSGQYDPDAQVVQGTWHIDGRPVRFRSRGQLLEMPLQPSSGRWRMTRQDG